MISFYTFYNLFATLGIMGAIILTIVTPFINWTKGVIIIWGVKKFTPIVIFQKIGNVAIPHAFCYAIMPFSNYKVAEA